MRTDRLIEILSSDVEPMKRGLIFRALVAALMLGGIAAFCAMLATLGLRSDVWDGFPSAFLAVKLTFALSVVAIGAAILSKSVLPGQDERKWFILIFLPFLAVGVAGAVSLALEQPAAWRGMVLGTHWATCLVCTLLFAVIPFVILMWALRKGAPTNLMRTGAIAGLVAGAVGATAYAFHCPDDALPFIAVWYIASISLCAAIGASLGPSILRW